jgi:hypothetical protein
VIDQLDDLLWSDYFLLSLGIVSFCLVFTILVWKIPSFYRRDKEREDLTPSQKKMIDLLEKSMRKACALVASFGLLGRLNVWNWRRLQGAVHRNQPSRSSPKNATPTDSAR